MSRFAKTIKKYERHFLLGLVIILLATFSVTGAIQCAGGGGRGGEGYGGSFLATPTERTEISDSDFVAWQRRYHLLGSLQPTIEFARYVQQASAPIPTVAAWSHIACVETARRAGYRVGDGETAAAVRSIVPLLVGEGRLPFSDALYDRFLRERYRPFGATEFQETVGEICLKDLFLTPFVESAKAAISPREAYERWRETRERVNLRFVALSGAPFRAAVLLDERARSTISTQEDLLRTATETAKQVRGAMAALEASRQSAGKWPESLKEVSAVVPAAAGKDPWGSDWLYEVRGEHAWFASAGPDGKPGTGDDLSPEAVAVFDTHQRIKEVAEAVLSWRRSILSNRDTLLADAGRLESEASDARAAGREDEAKAKESQAAEARRKAAEGADRSPWPDSIARLREPPVPGTTLAPLKRDLKDGWDREFRFEAGAGDAAPRLSSLGADGLPATEDDLVAAITADRAVVPAGPGMEGWLKPELRDPWERPLVVTLDDHSRPSWRVASLGADGVEWTADDLTRGNERELVEFFNRYEVKERFKLPIRREFRALVAHVPLLPDEVLAALWADFPQHRPDEEKVFTRWTYYHPDPYYTAADPRDPEKGHGAALALAIAPGAPAVLVPARSVFGDPPPDFAKDDPLKKEYLDEGWREVLLREQFVENLWNDLLGQVRASREAIAAWEKKPEGPERGERPVEVTVAGLLTGPLAKYLPAGGAPWAALVETKGLLEAREWKALPGLSDDNFTISLGQLTAAGQLSPVPVQMNAACSKALLENIRYEAERQQGFEEVRERVLDPHFVDQKSLDRAAARLEDLRRLVERKQSDAGSTGPDEAIWQAALAEWAAGLGAPHAVADTGLFIGSRPPLAAPVAAGASPEEALRVRRRNFVLQAGYAAVKKSESHQDAVEASPGTFGRRVLTDPAPEGEGTHSAILVRVLDRRYPSEEEFSPTAFVEFMRNEAYLDLLGERGMARHLPMRGGTLSRAIAGFVGDFDWLRDRFKIETHSNIEMGPMTGR
jgi:hypothetical protein